METQNTNVPPPAFNNTCGRGPFSFGYEVNASLANKIMSNNGSSDPLVLQCHNKTSPYPTAGTVKTCFDWDTTLCIGGQGQQHACAVGEDCSAVDWSGPSAAPCLRDLLSETQEFGGRTFGFHCCGSTWCTLADQNGDEEEDYTQSCNTTSAYPDLWLCVKDQTSAACIRPQDNSTCSGHFSDLLVSTSSTVPPATGAFTTYSYNTGSYSTYYPPSSSSHSTLSDAIKTRIIAGTCVSAGALLIIGILGCFEYRRQKARDRRLAAKEFS